MMKNKILCSSIVSIFAIVLLMSFASAVELFSSQDGSVAGWTISPVDSWEDAGDYFISSGIANASLERIISTSGYQNIIFKYDRQLVSDWEADNNFKVSWSLDGTNYTILEEVIGSGSSGDTTPSDTTFISKTYNLPLSVNNNAGFRIKFECTTDATAEICRLDNIIIEGTAIAPTNLPDEITECTTTGNPNSDLRIKIDDVNVDGYGKDLEWLPLDEISVDIKVENKNTDDKIDNIVVGWGVYNKDTDEWYVDDEENDFDLKKKDDKTLTVTFKLDESIDELADGDYTLYVWANGELNDVDICASDSKIVDMIIESDFVVLDNIKFTSPVECGTELQILGDVWNIGDDDQEGVIVVIQNQELGITKKITISDVNSFDKEKLDALIQIPQDAKEKQYDFEFMVYDEEGEIYINDYSDDESSILLSLKVEGGCAVQSTASVSASLESGGKAGSELKIKATITNTGTKSVNYTLNAADYSAWATLVGIAPQTLTLNAGESKEALLTFNVAKDVSGDKLFNLEILLGSNLITKQPVSVPIESGGIGISGISLGENWYLWLIGALNVILVVIIIIIAVRVAKK